MTKLWLYQYLMNKYYHKIKKFNRCAFQDLIYHKKNVKCIQQLRL